MLFQNMTAEDWDFLREVLILWRYTDGDGNMRKFSSLRAAHMHKVQQAALNGGKAGQEKRSLEDVFQRSAVKWWVTLQDQVRLVTVA